VSAVVAAPEWDRLASSRFYSTAAWTAVCAASPGRRVERRLAHLDGEPACAAPVTVFDAPPPASYDWSRVLGSFGLPAPPPAGVMVGAPAGFQTDFLVVPGVDETAAVRAFVAELRAGQPPAGAPGGGGACVAMFLSSAGARAAVAAGLAAPPVFVAADAWLEIPESGWEGWLAGLPPKRRRVVRAEVRAFERAGHRIEHLALGDCHEAIAPLAHQTDSRYGHTGTVAEHVEVFARQVAGMGDAARVTLCRDRDGHPVAYCLYYVAGDTQYLRGTGFDYGRLTGAGEYFTVAYYEQLRRAGERGVRRIHAGLRTSVAKALRGAMLRPAWFVDLAEGSVLAGHADAVRRHNTGAYRQLASDPRTAAAVAEHDLWLGYAQSPGP
jgi:hypothetical protein